MLLGEVMDSPPPDRSSAAELIICYCLKPEGLDTKSMTRSSIIMVVEGGGGRAWAETRILLDYAGHHHPHEGGLAEARSLSVSNLSLTLNTAPSRILVGGLTFSCCQCVYVALAAATLLVEGSISVHRYKICDNEILHYTLKRNFWILYILSSGNNFVSERLPELTTFKKYFGCS